MEAQRKKKPSRLKRRMRGALAKLGGPMGRRLARDHVTDDTQVLVSYEQQPEVELDVVASTSKPEVVCAPSERPAEKKPIFVKFLNVATRFSRRKSTSGAEGKGKRGRKKKYNRIPEKNSTASPATSSTRLLEPERDRLIEAEEPEAETPITDDVTSAESPSSSAFIVHTREPVPVDQTAGDDGEKVKHSDREAMAESGPNDQPEVDDVTVQPANDDDVTRQHGDTKKHRKRKQAKRYAKRAGVTAWKGIRSSWKFVSSSLVMLTSSPTFTVNPTSGIVQAWQQWHGTGSTRPPTAPAH